METKKRILLVDDEQINLEFFDVMLNKLNVVVTPGAGFGAAGEGYFRISAFNSRENAIEVGRRLREELG